MNTQTKSQVYSFIMDLNITEYMNNMLQNEQYVVIWVEGEQGHECGRNDEAHINTWTQRYKNIYMHAYANSQAHNMKVQVCVKQNITQTRHDIRHAQEKELWQSSSHNSVEYKQYNKKGKRSLSVSSSSTRVSLVWLLFHNSSCKIIHRRSKYEQNKNNIAWCA